MGDNALVLRLMLTAGLIVAGGGAVAAAVLYALARGRRRPLFPPVGPVRAPGNGPVVLGAFGIFILTTTAVQALLAATGFFRALYGDDFPAGWDPQAAGTIRYLWAAAFAFPVQIGLMAWLVHSRGGTISPGRGWERSAVAGYLTWLMVTPVAFCVFALANLAHAGLTGRDPDKHPLTALGDAAGSREWALFALHTVLLAPILEEVLFRGLLLPWLAQTRAVDPANPLAVPPARRPLLVMGMAVGVAVVLHLEPAERAWTAGDHAGTAAHLVPGLFFLGLVPVYFLVSGIGRLRRHLRVRSRQHVRAVFASSALFAAVHATVWPSPVPLVVLAAGLGYLYLRTRNLVGPVVVHGMFNAVSAVYLLLGGPA